MQSASVGVAQRSAGSGVNDAVTVWSAYISNTQVVPVPLQSPPQPAKVCVASFQLAVRVTGMPSVCVVAPAGLTLPPAPGRDGQGVGRERGERGDRGDRCRGE